MANNKTTDFTTELITFIRFFKSFVKLENIYNI